MTCLKTDRGIGHDSGAPTQYKKGECVLHKIDNMPADIDDPTLKMYLKNCPNNVYRLSIPGDKLPDGAKPYLYKSEYFLPREH